MRPSLKTALPVTSDPGNLSFMFEHCTVFSFRVNGGHGTDSRTDGQPDGRNAALSRDGRITAT